MPDPARQAPFTAVVLAGERGSTDPLVQQSGVCCKALIKVDGKPMVLRVLQALGKSERVDTCIVSGPNDDQLSTEPGIRALLESGKVRLCPSQATPSTSAYRAMENISSETRVMVTTADHPLLSASMVDQFCTESTACDADMTVGLAPYELVKQAFPQMKKTVLHFREGNYCGANLFTFLTPESRRMAEYWRRVENQRKSPLRLIRLLGWSAVLKYLLGALTLDGALASLSRRFDLRLSAVILPYAEAAVDIDSVADHTMVQEKLSRS